LKVCGILLHSPSTAQGEVLGEATLTAIRSNTPDGFRSSVAIILNVYVRFIAARPARLSLTEHEKCLAEVMEAIAHGQCEATQYCPSGTVAFLDEIILLSNNTGYSGVDLTRWHGASSVRKSLVELATTASEKCIGPGRYKPFKLSDHIRDLFVALSSRVMELRLYGKSFPQRQAYSEGERPRYNPASGEAYFFSQDGRRIASWPKFTQDGGADGCETCDHPDWLKVGLNGMSEGMMSVACLDSYTGKGFHFMMGHECKADAAGAIFCYLEEPPDSLTLDTPCQHGPYVNSRIGFFIDTQLMCDRWHRLKHLCRRIFNPDDFERFSKKNLSYIEQWHALQKTLKKMVAGATMEHAAFYACLLHDYHYNMRCDELNVPEIERHWPDA
jgi:hypothetical protein